MEQIDLAAQLVRDLNEAFGTVAVFEDIEKEVDNIERRIARELKAAILGTLLRLDNRIRGDDPDNFFVAGRPFQIFVADHISRPGDLGRRDVIGVTITERVNFQKLPQSRIRIEGPGRYTRGIIEVSTTLATYTDKICQLTEMFYRAGYLWLTEFLREKAERCETKMAVDLYRAVRLAFSEKQELAKHVRLVAVNKESGLYIFDQRSTEQTIERVGVLRGSTHLSPAAMFLGLLGSVVDYDDTFSQQAIDSRGPIRIDLSQAKYLESKTLLALSEEVLYDAESGGSRFTTVFPLVKNEPPYLLAVFQSAEDNIILPILENGLSEIQRIFEKQRHELMSLILKLRNVVRANSPIPYADNLMIGVGVIPK
jgi:hypothetical protein